MSETTAVWQGLMDEAYETYGEKRYEDFLCGLSEKHREAVLLGNLNYQVENGGISQWVCNGYATSSLSVRMVLKKVGTPLALELDEKIKAFTRRYVDLSKRNQGFMGDYWRNGEDASLQKECETFDNWYYEINEKFMEEVEKYFS